MNYLGTVKYIVVHTFFFSGVAGVKEVYRWHTDPRDNLNGTVTWKGKTYASRAALPLEVRNRRGNGWSDIGYHEVVRRDGSLELGRDIKYAGAHVAGINSSSIGIACEGNGEEEELTPAQRKTLIARIRHHMKERIVGVHCVIGHKEVNDLVSKGVVPTKYRTTKTCPGKKISMDEIRENLSFPPVILPRVKIEDTLPKNKPQRIDKL
jgi:hypothetical protein